MEVSTKCGLAEQDHFLATAEPGNEAYAVFLPRNARTVFKRGEIE
jgi:hypothetical protein